MIIECKKNHKYFFKKILIPSPVFKGEVGIKKGVGL